jgi:hypothetical protein
LVQFFLQCHPTSQKAHRISAGFCKEDDVNRNQLIVGLIIFTAFIILFILGFRVLIREWKPAPAQTGQREPLPALGYCTSNQAKPCVLSFNLNNDGTMTINLLVDSSLRGFDLTIKQDVKENIYKCQKMNRLSTSASCVGETLPTGEVFQFRMISRKKDAPLAEGNFSIIGLALATPEIFLTPTPTPPPHRYR